MTIEQLKAFRKISGLTEKEVAEMIGSTKQTINNFELGKYEITKSMSMLLDYAIEHYLKTVDWEKAIKDYEKEVNKNLELARSLSSIREN